MSNLRIARRQCRPRFILPSRSRSLGTAFNADLRMAADHESGWAGYSRPLRFGRYAVKGTSASPLMSRCLFEPLCDVIAVYRESSNVAESRFGPFQSGNRFRIAS